MTALRIALCTLGCKVNQAESESWARAFASLGGEIVGADEPADVVVVNTCSVTHVADRKSRQALRAAKRRNPEALVVATGCYSSVEEDIAGLVPEVDIVVPQSDKDLLVSRVAFACSERGRPLGAKARGAKAFSLRTRAFVKVADGCDRHCSFCIVPIARGRPRSRPIEDVLADVRARAAEGYPEIVLTAVRLGLYGRDLPEPSSLVDLVSLCLDETDGPRFRLSSLEPDELTTELVGLWPLAGGRLCRHVHMALDSGSDAVLARMRRRYSSGRYAEAVHTLRATVPEMAVTTDVIVGFPGETEAQFEETVAFVESMRLAQVHVFPYSARPGTAAAKLDGQVPPRERERRCALMLEVASRCARRHREGLVGSVRSVLYEEPADLTGRAWRGLTDDYVRVVADGDATLRGRIALTAITSTTDDVALGELRPADGSITRRGACL